MPYLELEKDLKTYYEIHDFTDPWKKAETILFVHGFTENTTAWRAWVPHLSRKYRLILFDIRGFGRTGEVPETFEFSTDLYVSDIVRIIDGLAGEPVHIVSGKSGGISAMHLAATRPDLVRSLTLACPPLVAPGSGDWLPYMEEHGIRSWAEKTMPARLGHATPKECLDWWADMMGSTSLSTAKAYLRWVVTTEPRREMEQIKCPVFVIMTAFSKETNSAAGLLSPEIIKKGMPQSEIFILEKDCYHAAGSDPDICAERTLNFLNKLGMRKMNEGAD